MRVATGISVVLAVMAAPAFAGPIDGGFQPVPAIGTITPLVRLRVAPDFQLRADMTTATSGRDPFSDPQGLMRHRFASSMIDFFPLGGTNGLRVSGGMRFYENAYFFRDAEQATGGLLWAPQFRAMGAALRGGYSRYTPAVTVGYTASRRNATFGLEIGSLLGSATSLPSRESGLSNAPRSGLNPIAHVQFGVRF